MKHNDKWETESFRLHLLGVTDFIQVLLFIVILINLAIGATLMLNL